jgi:hypothetical protein
MALTELQRTVCRLIAAHRIAQGESYVAGGVALNALIGANRVSKDIDFFHDTDEALAATWDADRGLLVANGYDVEVLRERPTFVEAVVGKGGSTVLVQWVRDSAYRFFPLLRDEDLGLVLHPFDLATNKTLALVGRMEVRDWVDLIACHDRIQPLGFLVWAACGKDPGYSPATILEQAARARYSGAEVAELSFAGPPPDAAALGRAWHGILAGARDIVAALPPERVGQCVLRPDGTLHAGEVGRLRSDLATGAVLFHPGAIRGAFPRVRPGAGGG